MLKIDSNTIISAGVHLIKAIIKFLSRKRQEKAIEKLNETAEQTDTKIHEEVEVVQPVMEEQPIIPVENKQEFNIINVVDDLPKHQKKRYKTRSLDRIKQIVVHHSLTEKGSPRAFANFHIDSRGWPGIGYHYVIDKKGQIFLTNFLTTISYHVDNANTRSVGICLVGNFDVETPPQVQIDALNYLIRLIRKDLKPDIALVKHNEFSPKSCPGTNFEPHFATIKQQFDEDSKKSGSLV